MDLEFNYWTENTEMAENFFQRHEIRVLKKKLQQLKKIDCVVFCSFESRFAKSGGLAAVTTKILPYLREVKHIPNVILMTPFYPNIMKQTELSSKQSVTVPFANEQIEVKIFEYSYTYAIPSKGLIKEYYLKADPFFGAKNRLNDPYVYHPDSRRRNNLALQKNSLFFCKSVPFALKKLGIHKNMIFHLQDWQTILIALTSKIAMIDGTLESCGSVYTMHNPFDSGWLQLDSLAEILDEDRQYKMRQKAKNDLTALKVGVQLVDTSVTTVSDNFAMELKEDILHTRHFIPHLQEIMNAGHIRGVNNGMFVNFPDEFSEFQNLGKSKKVTPNTIRELKRIKLEKRLELLKVLDEYQPPERFGPLTYKGGPLTTGTQSGVKARLPENVPIILMSGRLDLNQKGFDILLQALQRFNEDEIKAVFTPMPIRASDLDYFHKMINQKSNGNITVFPIRMEKGFKELQIGSTFGIMPSIYEPFGAAIEYMVNGTLVIARKTGGLVDQIDDEVNGFLFKESKNNYNLVNIENFVNASANVVSREKNPWCQDLVDSLYESMRGAMELYRKDNNRYYEMAANGLIKAGRFSWQISSKKYYNIYQGK